MGKNVTDELFGEIVEKNLINSALLFGNFPLMNSGLYLAVVKSADGTKRDSFLY